MNWSNELMKWTKRFMVEDHEIFVLKNLKILKSINPRLRYPKCYQFIDYYIIEFLIFSFIWTFDWIVSFFLQVYFLFGLSFFATIALLFTFLSLILWADSSFLAMMRNQYLEVALCMLFLRQDIRWGSFNPRTFQNLRDFTR